MIYFISEILTDNLKFQEGQMISIPGIYSVVYMVSPSFSGSTLLSYLISSHTQVTTIGERNKFWRKMFVNHPVGSQTCSCGEDFKECDYWVDLKQFIEKEIPPQLLKVDFSDFYLFTNHYLARLGAKVCRSLAKKNHLDRLSWPFKNRFRAILDENFYLIKYILKKNGACYFLDSSKNPYHVMYLDSHPQISVKVIQIFRDGRGYLHSSLKRSPARSVEEICEEWNFILQRNQEILSMWGGGILNVKYENLCLFPKKELIDIFKFLDLEPSGFTTNFSTENVHIMGNNEMRLVKFSGIRNEEVWRNQLTKKQLNIFEKISGELNYKIGYTT